ncbi:DUF4870 domain-containing protein [Salipaludibacillus agaradhaerens]|uniref:DUF4870 domain-containing protein n=1 Tax=Salipaludibacillus agaradhaerens TaxID=76935 RepID=A0A9Q4B025_SALAG|nr:DUF4870 domain-containing protein [Salipaludibacillus agaradhaerens]UJW58346.1 DUF4870 domain-containing protein [Bacillus sp. A116_S68]MCR6095829.1 DUF4870 domain-containing protein [Salipaludibacillus agaradhaerens]MCR6107279.1 DUF4870 domain-containing protein [Salipaludibacillus agaradhaerens]MCR6114611.1 DUF4870 domain-containing protein [Salipaludibacillus agaradhaerens]MCR6119308.1 DUF4870 domain-containing protein [Salipaludibacillus agaradhaerens]
MITHEDKTFAMLIYVLSFFSGLIGPLIIWLLKKNESEFIDAHGKAYFNFLISYAIYGIISFLLIFILIGFILIAIIGILTVVFTIIAAIKAYNGEHYDIPLTIKFLKY